jgi:hypothetical protein
MEQKDIETLLMGREIVVMHQNRPNQETESDEIHSRYTKNLLSMLKTLGFANELGEGDLLVFKKFNDEMNYKCMEQYYIVSGNCDKCKGVEGGPRCRILFGDIPELCMGKKLSQKQRFKSVRERVKGVQSITESYSKVGDRIYGVCPPGYGYYIDISSFEEMPFDPSWTVDRPVNRLWEYREFTTIREVVKK